MRWALVNSQTNIVENVVIWDGEGDLFAGTLNVLLTENEPCAPEWIYNSKGSPRFTEPV